MFQYNNKERKNSRSFLQKSLILFILSLCFFNANNPVFATQGEGPLIPTEVQVTARHDCINGLGPDGIFYDRRLAMTKPTGLPAYLHPQQTLVATTDKVADCPQPEQMSSKVKKENFEQLWRAWHVLFDERNQENKDQAWQELVNRYPDLKAESLQYILKLGGEDDHHRAMNVNTETNRDTQDMLRKVGRDMRENNRLIRHLIASIWVYASGVMLVLLYKKLWRETVNRHNLDGLHVACK